MAFDFHAKTTPALMLDEILEQIFLYLDSGSLLASRLVCRLWRSAATPHLRKKIQINLYNFKLGVPDSNKNNQEDKSLDDLSNILEQSEAFNFLFPCNNFSFTQTLAGDIWANFSDSGFQNFLYTHGPKHIKELSLSFRGRGDSYDYYCPHESVVMWQIQNLLLNQTPNLNTLALNIDSNHDWENKNYNSYEWRLHIPLQVTDPEYHEIHQKFLSLPPSNRNTSLKVFKLVGELPAKVFEIVILLCPNLQEVVCEDENFLPYILEPVCRVQLLKTLDFDLSPSSFRTIEKIVHLQQEHAQWDLKLSQLTLSFHDFRRNRALLRGGMEPVSDDRIFCVINQILAKSADSLKTFVWNGIIYLKELQLPSCLPNVTRIELSCQRNGREAQLFPTDFFRLPTTFPKLNHISLHWNTKNGLNNYLNLLNPSGNPPVLSVKSVDIIFSKSFSHRDLSTEILQQVCDVFPNAFVRDIYNEVPKGPWTFRLY